MGCIKICQSLSLDFCSSHNIQRGAGKVEEFQTPENTEYKLEVWGAQGGGWGSHSNYEGGYSKGYKKLNTILFVCCGGKGYDDRYTDGTCYNGGGHYLNKHGGGGATHIAAVTGELKNLANNKDDILIVAGGGGSNGGWQLEQDSPIGRGGGLYGGGSSKKWAISYKDETHTDYNIATVKDPNSGGGQTGCGTAGIKGGFGYGANGGDVHAGSGGGGWYGGNASGGDGLTDQVNGGGGSGYIDGVDKGVSSLGKNTGNGKALISWPYAE